MSKQKRKPEPTWQDLSLIEQIKEKGGSALILVSRYMEYGTGDPALFITKITIKAPKNQNDDYFVIVNAVCGGEHLVAFGSGQDATGAISATMNRIANGSIKWREDEFAVRRPDVE